MTLEEIKALIDYNGPDRMVHFTDYILLKAEQSSKYKIFKSKFETFEEKMGGIAIGEVIVVTGNRKEGKTLFVESWVRSMIESNPEAKTVFFSYETNPDSIAAKYMHDESAPLYLPLVLESGNFEWLKAKCLEAKYKFNAKIIVVDHLGFIVDMASKLNYTLNVGAVVRNLKRLATEHGFALILIAHQNQPKEGKEASVDNIGHSAAIGQDSDATIVVMRREDFDPVELRDIELKRPMNLPYLTRSLDASEEDKHSTGLALVKIDCNRRTGTYRWKKLFQKRGPFLVEV